MNDRGYLIYCGFLLSESFFSRAYIEMCFPSYYDLPFTHRFYVSKEQAKSILDYYMQFQKKKKEERRKKKGSSLEPVGKKLQYSRKNLINL